MVASYPFSFSSTRMTLNDLHLQTDKLFGEIVGEGAVIGRNGAIILEVSNTLI
jgi:hypothetical protein